MQECNLDFRHGVLFDEVGSRSAIVYCHTCDLYHPHWVNKADYFRPDHYQFNQKPSHSLREKACCYYCGIADSDGAGWLRVDHIIPQSKGGGNGDRLVHHLSKQSYYDNLVFCCRYCNSIKGTKTIEDAKPKLLKRRANVVGYRVIGDASVLAFEEVEPV